jgi:hypothetical protein
MKKIFNYYKLLTLSFILLQCTALVGMYEGFGADPLECGSWGVQLQAGIRPIIWRHRSDILVGTGTSTTGITTTSIGSLPKFSSLYHLPFEVGGQLSYAWNSCSNLFLEFNYARARAKSASALGTSSMDLATSRFRLYEGYVGARYYCNRWYCDTTALFAGVKVGFVHHKASGATLNQATNAVIIFPAYVSSDYSFFGRNTSIAGGAQVGLDILVACDWSVVLTAEVVACKAFKAGQSALCGVNSAVFNGGSSIELASVGAEVAFPLTVGLKYNF